MSRALSLLALGVIMTAVVSVPLRASPYLPIGPEPPTPFGSIGCGAKCSILGPIIASRLSGRVLFSPEESLPGVAITACPASGTHEPRTVSDSRGRFSLPSLPPGSYVLCVSLSGFTPLLIPLTIDPSVDDTSIDLTLRIAPWPP